ncbi:MAG: hypothetical protein OXU36_01535 [Candidatus Poribacteria bacterium]|nr:hypothetical protein [Candidatus Poribacteria bacterium]
MKNILIFSVLFCAIVLPLRSETAMETDIAAIKTDIAVIKTEIKNLNKKIDDKFESIEKNFDRQNNLIIACITIPMALIAILVTWRSIKDNTQNKQIEELTQEIEDLKLRPSTSTSPQL